MPATTKPSRRRFQFGLRSLFLVVAIASIGFGWLGYKVRQAQRQNETVKDFRKLGALVHYDYEFDSGDCLVDSPTPPGPVWLRKLAVDGFFANVFFVNMSVTATDAELFHVQELSQLKMLCLGNSQVTDAGLVNLKCLTQLKSLDLFNTQITDAGLVYLQDLTQLEALVIRDTRVTDAGCQELQKALPNVKIYR